MIKRIKLDRLFVMDESAINHYELMSVNPTTGSVSLKDVPSTYSAVHLSCERDLGKVSIQKYAK